MEESARISSILSSSRSEYRVTLKGWLTNLRSSGGILFLIVRDGTGIIQCALKKSMIDAKSFQEAKKLTQESTIEVSGLVSKEDRAPGGYEIRIDHIKVFSLAQEGYPIAKKYHGPEFLLDNRHLWIRDNSLNQILRVRGRFLDAARQWFNDNDFTEFHSPTLITAACEGGSTLFEVDYFGSKAYLSQSWQLYAEAAIASLGRIYTIAPSFRAEKSRTRRHLTEYWHLEVEMPWCDLDCVMNIQENLLDYVFSVLVEKSSSILQELGRNPKDILKMKPPYKRIRYDKAVEILSEKNINFEWGNDLGWKEEKMLAMDFDKPFFITHFPKKAKAFYHKVDPKNPETTLSADLLAPEGYGEITGGGQRIDDYNQLLNRIKKEKLNPKDYNWYLDLRRYGSVPHAGFGLGVERILSWICKLKHIRDSIAFPRLINRVYP